MARRGLVLVGVMMMTPGCDEGGVQAPPDAPPDAAPCPMEAPEATRLCAPTDPAICTYLIERCECGPDDIVWTCECTEGSWSCSRGYDCYPCP